MTPRDGYIDLFRDLSKKVDDHNDSTNARLDNIHETISKIPNEVLDTLDTRLNKIEDRLSTQEKETSKQSHILAIGTKIGIGLATAFTTVFMWLLHSVLGLERTH